MGQAASRQEAFWEACGFGHKERVRRYLELGDIDVNWVSYTHDCCPIHVASQGKPEIVKMLIAANCNVNVQDNRGNTPLHHAAMKGHSDIIKLLTEAGAEVNVQDKNNWTPLHCACYWNHSETVRVLLNLGADVNTQNKDNRTVLHETARSQEADDLSLGEITQMLIDRGADLNCKGCSDLGDLEADFTGLMYAAYHNHPDVASALIEAGCDVDAHGSNLWTALHWSADRGHEEMVYLLLGAGADPTKRGLRDETAADRAEKPELKEMLNNAVNMFNEMRSINKVGGDNTTDSKVGVDKGIVNKVGGDGPNDIKVGGDKPSAIKVCRDIETEKDKTIFKKEDENKVMLNRDKEKDLDSMDSNKEMSETGTINNEVARLKIDTDELDKGDNKCSCGESESKESAGKDSNYVVEEQNVRNDTNTATTDCEIESESSGINNKDDTPQSQSESKDGSS